MSVDVSAEAKAVLAAHGWVDGARGDVRPLADDLTRYGFDVSPPAAEFLAAFDGLTVRVDRPAGPYLARFDARDALRWVGPEDIPFVTKLIGTTFCPVGHGGTTLWYVTPAGEMILFENQWLGYSKVNTIRDGLDWVLRVRVPADHVDRDIAREDLPPGY